jgi:Domain of unknown function (DUF5710)
VSGCQCEPNWPRPVLTSTSTSTWATPIIPAPQELHLPRLLGGRGTWISVTRRRYRAGVERLWLDVPFAEKDQAKAAGARWDPEARRWFAPRVGMDALSRWAAAPPVPDVLAGEERTFGSGLFVDLVPSSCWFTNVRSCVSQRDWERLRRMVIARAGNRCEVCGRAPDREQRQWMEAHERWEYDTATSVQSLRRLICLCTACHGATHLGLAEIQGRRDHAVAQLMAVNHWTRSDAEAHILSAFEVWSARSCIDWHLDLSILAAAGVTLTASDPAMQRRHIAETMLDAARGVGPHTQAPVPLLEHRVPGRRRWWLFGR